jgi:DNA-binding CsgD family transcriptional regulator
VDSNKIKGNIMGYFSDLEYDIQELFIEGYNADEIAHQLGVELERVTFLLSRFGVDASDHTVEAA